MADKEINKVINCANHNLVAYVYVCPEDNEVIFSHNTCKSKLCSSCGIKSQKIKTKIFLKNVLILNTGILLL